MKLQPVMAICPSCLRPVATLPHGGALMLRRHTWFLTENAAGGEGRCPGSGEVAPLDGAASSRQGGHL